MLADGGAELAASRPTNVASQRYGTRRRTVLSEQEYLDNLRKAVCMPYLMPFPCSASRWIIDFVNGTRSGPNAGLLVLASTPQSKHAALTLGAMFD